MCKPYLSSYLHNNFFSFVWLLIEFWICGIFLLTVCSYLLLVSAWFISSFICFCVVKVHFSLVTVCSYLVSRGDKVEEDSEQGVCRLQMLRMLAAMNPKEALNIRALCVSFVYYWIMYLDFKISPYFFLMR